MSMEQGVDFSLLLKRMARKRKLVYDEDEDANVEMILQGDSKQQAINSSLQT